MLILQQNPNPFDLNFPQLLSNNKGVKKLLLQGLFYCY